MRTGRRVADRLAEYAAGTGQELAYLIRVLARSPAEHFGHPDLLTAELPEGRSGRDVVVIIELSGAPASARRQAVLDALAEGARLVWVIDASDPTVRAFAGPSQADAWHDDAVFDGGGVLPGFSCKVSDLIG